MLAFVPDDASMLLQTLRRLSADGGSGTLEWIYRPVEIKSGQRWQVRYRMCLLDDVSTLDHAVIESFAGKTPVVSDSDEQLLFQADFNDQVDASFAVGDGKAVVFGEPVFEDTPTGRGLRVVGDTVIHYRPDSNIDLKRGRLLVRFMPLWDGTDANVHYLFKFNAPGRYAYFGKVKDGRLLMTMNDGQGSRQISVFTSARAFIRVGTWYDVMFFWDAERGTQALYLDGKKLAERKHAPWEAFIQTVPSPKSMMQIPSGADMIVDDIRIWGAAGDE